MSNQIGGLLDNPNLCLDNETPLLTDITPATDILYVGEPLLDNNGILKYHCYTPDELIQIIKRDESIGIIPRNPITREELPFELINRVKNMFIIDDIQDYTFFVNIDLLEAINILNNIGHEININPLRNIMNSNGIIWNNWYNDTNISNDYKNGIIRLFMLINEYSMIDDYIYHMLEISNTLEELLYYTSRFGFTHNNPYLLSFIVEENNISGISLHYRDTDNNMSKLENIMIDDMENWEVINFIFIALNNDIWNNSEIAEDFMNNILVSNNKKLVSIPYNIDESDGIGNYTDYIMNILDFYEIENISDEYNEYYSTYNENNEKQYIGR